MLHHQESYKSSEHSTTSAMKIENELRLASTCLFQALFTIISILRAKQHHNLLSLHFYIHKTYMLVHLALTLNIPFAMCSKTLHIATKPQNPTLYKLNEDTPVRTLLLNNKIILCNNFSKV